MPEPHYTTWGWFVFLFGATAKPRLVHYRCWRCKQVLATTRDPNILAKFD